MKYENFTEAVHAIMQQYPESEWDKRIQAEYPTATQGEIVAAIEVALGGDVVMVDDA